MSSVQHNNSKLLWVIIAVLITLIGAYALYERLNHSDISQSPKQDTLSVAKTDLNPMHVNAVSEAEAPLTLVDEDLLSARVPENPSLAKEEIAKLDDLQLQLKQQAESLQAQHDDADALTQLKEEQIKLLEAQLAAQ